MIKFAQYSSRPSTSNSSYMSRSSALGSPLGCYNHVWKLALPPTRPLMPVSVRGAIRSDDIGPIPAKKIMLTRPSTLGLLPAVQHTNCAHQTPCTITSSLRDSSLQSVRTIAVWWAAPTHQSSLEMKLSPQQPSSISDLWTQAWRNQITKIATKSHTTLRTRCSMPLPCPWWLWQQNIIYIPWTPLDTIQMLYEWTQSRRTAVKYIPFLLKRPAYW